MQFGFELVRDIVNPISNLAQKVEFVDQERVRAREEKGLLEGARWAVHVQGKNT